MRLEILTWMGDIAALGLLIYLIVNISKFDRHALLSAIRTIMIIWIGMKIPLLLPDQITSSFTSKDSFSCTTYKNIWWQCGDWHIFYEEFYLFSQKISEFFHVASTLPAFIILGVTYWYIINRLAKGIKFSTEELIMTFFGSIVIYLSLLAAPQIVNLFSDAITSLARLKDNQANGVQVLESWFMSYNKYKEFAAQGHSSWNINAGILRLLVFIPFILITIVNILIILLNFFLISVFPVGLFKAAMDRHTDFNQGFKILYMIGLIGAFSAFEWTLFSWLPELTVPNDINDSSIGEILVDVGVPSVLITFVIALKGKIFIGLIGKPALRMLLTMRYT